MRYRDIADRLADAIIRSHKPGDRLPGLRDLAKREGISLITARNVYLDLARKGIVELRQGSGTYVAGQTHSEILDLATIRPAQNLLMWVGDYLHTTMEGLLTYDPPEGYGPLRQAAGDWLSTQGVAGLPLITGGSQQALFITGLALLKPGDVVVVEDPGYLGASRIFESLGAKVIPVDYLRTPQDLERLKHTGIKLFYSMPQGHIPTGLSMPDAVRTGLLQLAEDLNFFILEDDPLSDIVGLSPLKAQDKAERVIYIKSLSSILGPGLRLGFCMPPASILPRMVRLKEINDLSLSGLLQRMVHAMLASGEMRGHIARLQAELDARRTAITERFGWQTQGPCLWIDTASPSRIHMENLLKHNIRITPGDIYGSRWSNHIRLSLISTPAGDLMQGLAVIRTYLEQEAAAPIRVF